MQKSEFVGNLVKALIAAKKEFKPVLKLKENPFFKRDGKPSKYADLEAAIEATQDALAKNGLVISQFPIDKESRVGVRTLLMHESGEFVSDEFTLPLAKQDAQTGVAAVTYARRTGYLATLGIAAEDDDGNTASGKKRYMDENDSHVEVRGGASDTVTVANAVTTHAETPSKPVSVPTTPQSGNLPDSTTLDSYRQRIRDLHKQLSAAGLKASRGVKSIDKIVTYLLTMTGAAEVAQISNESWKTFFDHVDKLSAEENGFEKLAKTINSVALKNKETA